MKTNKIAESMQKIKLDEVSQAHIWQKIRDRRERNMRPMKKALRRLVPAAACAALIVTLALALPHWGDPGHTADNGEDTVFDVNPEAEGIPGTQEQALPEPTPHINELPPPEFTGLPVDNHCLPSPSQEMDLQGREGVFSRMGVSSLLDIFSPGRAVEFWEANPVQAFAFVRVTETVQEEYFQIATAQVLETVWTRGRQLPESLTLRQFSGAIMCCTPYGELMRVGGVFLLPLWYNDGEIERFDEGWFNWTYFDVLFEVDDNGRVWSRSNSSGFNRFDGEHTSVLTGAILGIINDEENLGRDIAHTAFGVCADDGVLAIVTAVSSESEQLFPGSPGREMWTNWYTVRVEEILSEPTEFGAKRGGWLEQQKRWRENWQVTERWWDSWGVHHEITTQSYTLGLFRPGGRYLVFIEPSYSGWSAPFTIFSDTAAKISPDGTITPVRDTEDDQNAFDEYNGYTVERIAELAHLANTWHERYRG